MLKINKACGLVASGDSFTVGQGASTPSNSYASKLASAIGGTFTNNAVAGQGVYIAAQKAMSAPNKRRSTASVLAGLNDARRIGMAAEPKIKANLHSLICANLLSTSSPASALSRTGAWTALSSSLPSRALALGGSGMYTNDINATMTYNFVGSKVVIGTFTTGSGSVYQDLDYSIDGGPRVTFTNASLTNEAYGHNAIMIDCGSFAAHTLTIYPKSATPWTVVDYVGVPIAEPMFAAPIVAGHIPYVVNWVYSGFTLTPAIVDALNAAIDDVVLQYTGFPIDVVRTNDFYDTSTGCSTDGVHPNDTGHNQIYSAFSSKLEIWS